MYYPLPKFDCVHGTDPANPFRSQVQSGSTGGDPLEAATQSSLSIEIMKVRAKGNLGPRVPGTENRVYVLMVYTAELGE